MEGMRAAKAAGAVVSFDLNFRDKLWAIWGGTQKAVEVLDRIVRQTDVLVGNEEDLQKALNIAGPQAASGGRLDPGAFLEMINRVVARYPQLKVVATTLREVRSTNRPTFGALSPGCAARATPRPSPS